MTLAELLAVVGMCAPGNLRALDPLIAAVPLLAQRRGVAIDAVYAMPAGEAIGAIADELADWISDDLVASAAEAMQVAQAVLAPPRMRERMLRRVASDQG